jgi:hypothetical protein
MEASSRVIRMCDRVLYRRNGDLYECLRISPDGEEESLGIGTREDILSWLVSHGFGYVRQDVLEKDLELLSEEEGERSPFC